MENPITSVIQGAGYAISNVAGYSGSIGNSYYNPVAASVSGNWSACTSIGTGNIAIACVNGGSIYQINLQTGAITTLGGPTTTWSGIAACVNAPYIACVNGGKLYYGATSNAAPVAITGTTDQAWSGVAVGTTSGSNGIACVNGGGIYISSNVTAGASSTWTLTSAASNAWTCVAMNTDLSNIYAGQASGQVFRSTDAGATWTSTGSVSANWVSMCRGYNAVGCFAATSTGAVYLFDGTSTWTLLGAITGKYVANFGNSALGITVANPGGYIYTNIVNGGGGFGASTWRTSTNTGNWTCVCGNIGTVQFGGAHQWIGAGVSAGKFHTSSSSQLSIISDEDITISTQSGLSLSTTVPAFSGLATLTMTGANGLVYIGGYPGASPISLGSTTINVWAPGTSTFVRQPFIQHGVTATNTASTASITVTLPRAYTSATAYRVMVTPQAMTSTVVDVGLAVNVFIQSATIFIITYSGNTSGTSYQFMYATFGT